MYNHGNTFLNKGAHDAPDGPTSNNCSIPYKFEDTNIGNKKPKMKGQTTQWFTKYYTEN